ncbi:hypothetical protein AXG93_1860s1340 [Marchantia polymorpha subsp. ruderalis]|uniref:Polymerase nucleotidyl transferase domain-containing protein n=2 Tax=Marchantia polymorpha TaxID=3197 RepID=A0A176VEJ6_MARPO|nr:hypothetical protein AXG93_1860s1340 [Marchantia polymorpha subsp. ruderalis]
MKMEAQQLVDALTDHLAIYHRSSAPKTESRERQRVVEWLAGLNYEQRQAALTVVDGPWVAILLMMQKYLVAEGRGSFILLPDVPGDGRESSGAELGACKSKKGKLDDNTCDSKSTRPVKLHRGLKGSDPTDKGCTRCSSTLPGLCFRRARGLVRRLQREQEAGDLLVSNIRLFSSGDGEGKVVYGMAEARGMLDCISISNDLLRNVHTFLEVMDDISHHEFLKSPCPYPASPWEEMPWLKGMGYYSLPAFIANKFEFGLWSAWRYAQGSKKPPRSLALKLKDPKGGRSGKACSCDLHSNVSIASSIIGKKLGCINWWARLPTCVRGNMIKSTLAVTCKYEVMKLFREARTASSKGRDLNLRGKNKNLVMNSGETRLRNICKGSLSDTELDQAAMLGRKSANGAAVAPLLTGLKALKELSEAGLLCGKSEGMNSAQEADASWLFDSTLKSAHTLSDRVLRKVRNVLVKVNNARVEIELLGDENNASLHSNNGGESSEVKSTKTKKKRRKQTSAHKLDVSQQEEKGPTCKPKSVKGQEDPERRAKTAVGGEVENWSPGAQQLVLGSKTMSVTQESSGRKGKGGKSKSKKVERLNHDPKLHSKISSMNGKSTRHETANQIDYPAASDVNMHINYDRQTDGDRKNGAPDVAKDEQLDQDCTLLSETIAVKLHENLPESKSEDCNGFHIISGSRKGKRGVLKSRVEEKESNKTVLHMTKSLLKDKESSHASVLNLMDGMYLRSNGPEEVRKDKLENGEQLCNGHSLPFSDVVEMIEDDSLASDVKDMNGGIVCLKRGKAHGVESVGGVSFLPGKARTHHWSGVEQENMVIHHEDEGSCNSRPTFQNTISESRTEMFDTSVTRDVVVLTDVDQRNPDSLPIMTSRGEPCQNVYVQNSVGVLSEHTGKGESSTICFGTFDTVVAESPKIPNPSVHLETPLKFETPILSSSEKAKEPSDLKAVSPGRTQAMDLGNWSEGASHSRHIRNSLNGIYPPTKTSRQLEFASNGVPHYQQGPIVRPGPHEWPGSVQVGYSGAYNQPTASDWLQLDVGRGLPPRIQSSLLAYRSTPVSTRRSAQVESSSPVTPATRSVSLVNQEWPSFVQSFSVSPPLAFSVPPADESSLRPVLNPSQLSSGSGELEGNGRVAPDEFDIEDRFAYDTDVDDYGVYKAGEFDDFDGYMISEEESERYLEDVTDSSAADYNQIFGGGVMYWNAADYAGMGYSRPGSLSSEDSSWARHEADLSVVLDDIVSYQLIQGAYPGKGSAVSNVTSSSPPSATSLPKTFEHLSPVGSTNSRHSLSRHVGNEFPGKFSIHTNQVLSTEEQSGVSRGPSSSEVIDKIRVDSSPQPILRPIVVVRDLSLSRHVSSGEALRLQEAKSPHIVPRSRRDFPCHKKRPPSPVLRCVPPAPPPPPPSPVAGPRRRKGFMAARSGSSSPRHWGLVNWSYKDEPDNMDGKAKGGNPEGLVTSGRRRVGLTNTPPMHPLSGALLRERLISVPPLALEQEHLDSTLPMKTTLIQSSNPGLLLALPKLLKAIHVEIEAFCIQVAKENKRRKPFVNTAVKKVAHSLQVLWPRSRTKIFGSIATGLALPTSDVDLVVCLPPVRNLEPIKEAGILEGRNGIKETCLQHAARYLADQDWVKNDSLKTIENTLVPIIILVAEFLPHQCEMEDEDSPYSFGPNLRKDSAEDGVSKVDTTTSTAALASMDIVNKDLTASTEVVKGPWGGKADRQLVRLDISFEAPSHTGLRTAELVRELIGQYPALSPLALVLKQFLTDRSLDHPYTGGLSSYCLVLLITRFLQHQSHQSNLMHTGRQSSSQNLGSLFVDFLHFFGCVFDPRRMGVRIRGGGMYLSRDRFHGIDPLYIEDPLHPDNNVGRNCFRILQCVKAFADAYAVLEKKIHAVPNCTVDLASGAANFEFLQTILPGLVNT